MSRSGEREIFALSVFLEFGLVTWPGPVFAALVSYSLASYARFEGTPPVSIP